MVGHFPPRFMPQRQPSSSSLPTSRPLQLDNASAHKKTKLDISQRLERKLAVYNASETVWKRWLFEIISLLVSMVCMSAIVAIYLYIKNEPLAKLGDLLTFANILGKVASAALIVPTTEALGQLKWNWFHQSNAMYDFEIFDKATRGPWGAAMLLYRTKGRSLAALGAILILLLLAIDSFLQQVIDLPERWYLTGERGMARRLSARHPNGLFRRVSLDQCGPRCPECIEKVLLWERHPTYALWKCNKNRHTDCE